MSRHPFRSGLIGLVTIFSLWFGLPRFALAANITPTVFTDDLTVNGNCTLREAIQAANTNAIVDSCTAGSSSSSDAIWLSSGTYLMSIAGAVEDNNATGDFDITANVIIYGANSGESIVQGGGVSYNDRVFDVFPSVSVNFTSVTVSGGYVTDDLGAGIYSEGSVNFIGGKISGNTAAGTTGAGGGLYANGGTLVISQAYIAQNTAVYGSGGVEIGPGTTATISMATFKGNSETGYGGAGLSNYGTATITNATFGTNVSTFDGGAIYNDTAGTLTIVNSTVSRNTASLGGGGISNTGTLSMLNTIIANNDDLANGSEDCLGTVTSNGYNLIGSTAGCTLTGTTTGNQLNIDPQLNATMTDVLWGAAFFAASSTSPIIDGGTNAGCPTTDQRMRSRPQVGRVGSSATCDLGALEFDFVPPVVTLVSVSAAVNPTKGPGSLVFNTTEWGELTKSGDCYFTPGLPALVVGKNTFTVSAGTTQGVHACTITLTDNDGNAGTLSYSLHVDTSAPRFAMNGPRTMYLNIGGTFIDPGVTAFDNLDSDINSRTTATSTVDLTRAGKYIVTYALTDWAGNNSGTQLRNVFVLPRVGFVTVTSGVATIKINGVQKKFMPFPGYRGGVFGRVINFGQGSLRYVFVQTSSTSNGSVRVITEQGKDVGTYRNSVNKKVSKLSLDSALTRSGIRADLAIDKNMIFATLAITPRNGKNVPVIITIDQAAAVQRPLTGVPAGGTTGNILVKHIPVTSGSAAIVTAVAGRGNTVRVWQRASSGGYVFSPTFKSDAFMVTANDIAFRPPLVSDVAYGPVINGKMAVTWKTNLAASGKVVMTKKSSTWSRTVSETTITKNHQVQVSATIGSPLYFQITSCLPKFTSAQGCMTAGKQLITPR